MCTLSGFREITDISILQSFIHLRFVDISKNNLQDITPLNSLTHMLTLKADNNKLTSAKLEELPYLQEASFNDNRIKTTEGINHPLLERISLNCEFFSLICIALDSASCWAADPCNYLRIYYHINNFSIILLCILLNLFILFQPMKSHQSQA